jgi:hypothetical protein
LSAAHRAPSALQPKASITLWVLRPPTCWVTNTPPGRSTRATDSGKTALCRLSTTSKLAGGSVSASSAISSKRTFPRSCGGVFSRATRTISGLWSVPTPLPNDGARARNRSPPPVPVSSTRSAGAR